MGFNSRENGEFGGGERTRVVIVYGGGGGGEDLYHWGGKVGRHCEKRPPVKATPMKIPASEPTRPGKKKKPVAIHVTEKTRN